MKKTIIALLCIVALLFVALTACDGVNLPVENNTDTTTSQSANNQTGADQSGNKSGDLTGDLNGSQSSDQTGDQSGNNGGDQSGEDGSVATTLAVYKRTALSALDSMIGSVDELEAGSIKEAILAFYNEEKDYVESLTDTETAKAAATKIAEDAKVFAKNTLKPLVIEKLNATIEPLIDRIPQEDIKTATRTFYNTEMGKLSAIETIDDLKSVYAEIVDDTKAFIRTESEKILVALKDAALEELDPYVTALIEKIPYDSVKTETLAFYNEEKAKLAAVDTADGIAPCIAEIKSDLEEFVSDKVLIALKDIALEELDPYVMALIEKIPYDSLKADTLTFYNEEKAKLAAVKTKDGIAPCIAEIKNDLEAYILSKTKGIAVAALEETVNAALDKIPNQELKDDLSAYAADEIAKINDVEDVDDVPDTLSVVLSETKAYIKELLAGTVKGYMSRLTEVENATAYDYLPKAMHPDYKENIVTAASIDYDFTTSTNVTSLNKAGFGEQWQMVVENINQSVLMAKVFNVAQTTLNAAGNAVDIYITNSYADEIEYNFEDTKYTGSFTFKNSVMKFDISFIELVTVPGIGSIQPVIRMEYDLTKEKKSIFISLGDAYKVKYTVSENTYEMVTRYGVTVAGKNASRSSYLSIEKDKSGKVVGHIYEYPTYESSDLIKACADFYVENGYVSVVGNKSSGMILFDGYINELYLANSGRLLGYEVRETKTISAFTATYDTLWFNLWDIQGIDSVLVTEKTKANESSRSTVDVYFNGSDELLSPTYNKKLTVKTSRKYDVELRNRYYYTYDEESDSCVVNEVEIPMFFIQEDNMETFSGDILKDNGITASVSLNETYLNKILRDYDTLIDIFIENKDAMSSEAIAAYLV